MREELPIELRVLAVVGGPADEATVSLALYGDELDPDEITAVLGCSPTTAHRRGDRKREGSVPFRIGAWILQEQGKPPVSVDDLLEKLLSRLPTDKAVWQHLAGRHQLQLRFGIFIEGWNRGFSISGNFMQRFADMGISMEFDLYAEEPGS